MFKVNTFKNGQLVESDCSFTLKSFAFISAYTKASSAIFHDLKDHGLSESDALAQVTSIEEKVTYVHNNGRGYQDLLDWLNQFPYSGDKFTWEVVEAK